MGSVRAQGRPALGIAVLCALSLCSNLVTAQVNPVFAPGSLGCLVNGLPVTPSPTLGYVNGKLYAGTDLLMNGLGIEVTVDPRGIATLSFFGEQLVVAVGSDAGQSRKGAVGLGAPVLATNGSVLVPLEPVCAYFGLSLSLVQQGLAIGSSLPVVSAVRYAEHDEYFRVVLDLSTAAPFTARMSSKGASVTLRASRGFYAQPPTPKPDGTLPAPPPQVAYELGFVLGHLIAIENGVQGVLRITVSNRYAVPASSVRLFTLGDPPRIVMDFYKIFEEMNTASPAPGIEKTWLRMGQSWGPVVAQVVSVDLSKGYRLDVAPAGRTVTAKAPVSQIAPAYGAVVAVNGGYFDFGSIGACLGLLIVDGEWVRLPMYQRTAMLIHSDGRIHFTPVDYDAQAIIGATRSLKISALNEWLPARGNALGVVTRWWGSSYPVGAETADREETVAAIVRSGTVQGVYYATQPGQRIEVPIPTDGYLLVGVGHEVRAVLKSLTPGTPCAVYLRLSPNYPDVVDALGGGPMVIRGGQVYIPHERERIPSDIVMRRNPHTAIGLTQDGKVLLAVVDGRQPSFSAGMYLGELAQLLLRFGAVEGMALDGGGSTTLVINGQVENSPSDGQQRHVANAVVVVRK